ncbi:MAG: hypothetical protein LAT63_07485 [Marinobacter sp.]|nr:hypothetical protein [Marinobacter sp.]
MQNNTKASPTRRHLFNFFIVLISVFIGTACTAKTSGPSAEDLEADAETLCSAYNHENWGLLQDTHDPLEIVLAIQVKLQKEIVTDEFKSLLAGTDARTFSEYHDAIAAAVPGLINRDWACEEFTNFFYPPIKVVNLNTGLEGIHHVKPAGGDTVYIEVFDSQTIEVNQRPLANSSPEWVEKALNAIQQTSMTTLTRAVLHVHQPDSDNSKDGIVEVLRSADLEILLVK